MVGVQNEKKEDEKLVEEKSGEERVKNAVVGEEHVNDAGELGGKPFGVLLVGGKTYPVVL